eukprot:TRINITY_DN66953_c8_g2_i3.p1 TRINITY_DN66953_c8_g2~~TRINITY_DN66953_c8_g2_i3.p1  ORF type:complete len:651 (+),score=298.78 TRINITY_DN66953_c8_g2_i3:176-2128(+)
MMLGIPSWLIGVSLNLIGSVVDNSGISMQKYSHLIAERQERRHMRLLLMLHNATADLNRQQQQQQQQGAERPQQEQQTSSSSSVAKGAHSRDESLTRQWQQQSNKKKRTSVRLKAVQVRALVQRMDVPDMDEEEIMRVVESFQRADSLDAAKPDKPSYYTSKWWIAGLTLFLLGNVINAVGLAFAPETLFAALATFALVSNAFNAYLFLGERLTPRILGGTALIIVGSVIACLFGSHTKESYTVDSLARLVDLAFLVYVGIMVMLLTILIVVISVLEQSAAVHAHNRARDDERRRRESMSTDSASDSGEGDQDDDIVIDRSHKRPQYQSPLSSPPSGRDKSKMLSEKVLTIHDEQHARQRRQQQKQHESDSDCDSASSEDSSAGATPPVSPYSTLRLPLVLRPMHGFANRPEVEVQLFLSFAYPAFSGLVGSVTVLLAKIGAELLKSSFEGHNQFVYPSTWVICGGALVSGATQIHWINLGLKKFDQLVVVPAFFVVYTTFSIIGGAVFFEELAHFSTTEWVLFPVGTCITFCGVYLLSTSSKVESGGTGRGISSRLLSPVSPLSTHRSTLAAVPEAAYSPPPPHALNSSPHLQRSVSFDDELYRDNVSEHSILLDSSASSSSVPAVRPGSALAIGRTGGGYGSILDNSS